MCRISLCLDKFGSIDPDFCFDYVHYFRLCNAGLKQGQVFKQQSCLQVLSSYGHEPCCSFPCTAQAHVPNKCGGKRHKSFPTSSLRLTSAQHQHIRLPASAKRDIRIGVATTIRCDCVHTQPDTATLAGILMSIQGAAVAKRRRIGSSQKDQNSENP